MSNKKIPILEWESYPLVENPIRSFILVVVMFAVISFLWIITVRIWETPYFYFLGIAFLLFPLLPYFILTRYQLFDYKIVVKYFFIKVERNYSDFNCYYVDKKGIMLGTFKMPRWLDSYRGQSLRFSKNQEEKNKLIDILEEKIGNRY